MQRRQRKMRPVATPKLRSFVAASALAAAVGAVFWLPAAAASHGYFPAPLDDVYIHFDFARSLAQGHPFEWVPGNGYSSGETSPLYAVVLALGWLVGFRGRLLGVWAAIVAVLAVASFVRSAQTVARPCPTWLAAGASRCSSCRSASSTGRSSAAWRSRRSPRRSGRRSSRSLVRARRIDERGGLTREAAQWRLGAWGAVLVLLRPEAGVLVGVFAVVAARAAARRSGIAAVLRELRFPGCVATALVLGANRLATGETQSAGAQLKLLSSNPYLSDVDRARAYVENIVTFAIKGVRAELSAVRTLGLVVPGLALASLASARVDGRSAPHACSARSRGCCSSRSTTTRRSTTSATTRRRCCSCSSRRAPARRRSRAGSGARAGRCTRRRARGLGDHRCCSAHPGAGEALHARRREHPRPADRDRAASRRGDGARLERAARRCRRHPVRVGATRARRARSRRLPANAVRTRGGERRGGDRRAHRAPRAGGAPSLSRALPELVRPHHVEVRRRDRARHA